jgi:probable addiction module antidote protein
MKEKITDFDVSAYLDNEETIAEYLTATLEENDPDLLLVALSNVAKARGMSQIARDRPWPGVSI